MAGVDCWKKEGVFAVHTAGDCAEPAAAVVAAVAAAAAGAVVIEADAAAVCAVKAMVVDGDVVHGEASSAPSAESRRFIEAIERRIAVG